jgi:hypothetical protein
MCPTQKKWPQYCARMARRLRQSKPFLRAYIPVKEFAQYFVISLTRVGNLACVFIFTAYRWMKRVDNLIRDLNRRRMLRIFSFIWVALRECDPIYCVTTVTCRGTMDMTAHVNSAWSQSSLYMTGGHHHSPCIIPPSHFTEDQGILLRAVRCCQRLVMVCVDPGIACNRCHP